MYPLELLFEMVRQHEQALLIEAGKRRQLAAGRHRRRRGRFRVRDPLDQC